MREITLRNMTVVISNDVDTGGTGYTGCIDISYGELVEKLGVPSSDGDGYKVDAEWSMEFENGVIATLYNYKDGPNYNGGSGTVENIRDWHIGGFDEHAVDYVYKLLGR